MTPRPGTHAGLKLSLLCVGLAVVGAAPMPALATVFRLQATNVVIDQPAPLFTSNLISGTLTLADSVAPGASFSSADLTGLNLDFGGILGTLDDVRKDIAPGAIQIFGMRSLDGKSLSMLDFRFGFPTTDKGCSFVCAGQILINSASGGGDPSNFIAVDDLAGNSLSVISSYTPQFTLVPEPAGWTMMITGLGLIGGGLRRRRRQAIA